MSASAFSTPLANKFARLLTIELSSGKGTVRSLGVLYGLLMSAAFTNDDRGDAFGSVNRVIMNHFGDGPLGKLDRIKAVAWDFYERAASAIEAPSGVETGNTDSTEGESATPIGETPRG